MVFKNRVELKRWIKQNPQAGLEWSIQWLKDRKVSKQLVYAPTQVELRSLVCPTMDFYDWSGGYYKITKELGFADRFTNEPLMFKPWEGEIIIDTREQSPLVLDVSSRIDTIKVGDYRREDRYDDNVVIERKSLSDFCGTLGKGFERFERELERAVDADIYVVMLVEKNISKALNFKEEFETRYVRTTPQHIFHNLRDLLNRYPLNFQCLFVDGRKEAAQIVKRIFQLGAQVKRVDLQHKHEKREL